MKVGFACPAGAPCVCDGGGGGQDALALLSMHREIVHPGAVPAQQNNSRKPEKFPRPNITVDTTDEVWQDFYTAWLQYKDEYGLTGHAVTQQLNAGHQPVHDYWRCSLHLVRDPDVGADEEPGREISEPHCPCPGISGNVAAV